MSRPAGEARTWGLFVLLSLIWGSSYLFIKIGLEEGVAPLTLVSIRTVLGTAFLALVMWSQHGRLARSMRTWGHLAIVGMFNIVVPYALITWGELYVSSGMAGILTALVPLFTVALASFALHDEPATVARLGGLGIGFVGVILLAAPSLDAAAGDGDGFLSVAGMIAVALAALSYAIAVVYTRRRLSGHAVMEEADGTHRAPTSLEVSFGQVFVGMVVITAVALVFERSEGGMSSLPLSVEAVLSLLWLGLLGTGVAYVLYFAIIGRWGATRATLIAYVMPIVAIVLGFLVLDERLRPIELAGTALILGGIVLVNGRWGQRPIFARTPST